MTLIARDTARTSSSPNESAARAGSTPARNRTSSVSRLPSPAIRDWSISTALTGAWLRPSRSRTYGSRTDAASGPSRSSSGSNSTAPRRRGSRRNNVPPSTKWSPNRRQAGLSPLAAYSNGSPAAVPSIRTRPLIPRCMASTGPPTFGPVVSIRSSFPRRRAAVSRTPGRIERTARGVSPRLRNQASGAWTFAISRSSARSPIRARAASASSISGTFAS